jgi:spore germination protein GerM
MPATDTPLTDTIRLLLQGPSVDERNRGLITLIPPDARFLSAQVRGSTAYLSFSEEFQFNTYGVEGYIGQLRQIIWTVTEFPNITDVQILIEGRRIDYLGERIAIGSPLGRNSL